MNLRSRQLLSRARRRRDCERTETAFPGWEYATLAPSAPRRRNHHAEAAGMYEWQVEGGRVPTKFRRENKFVELFLSACEDYSWRDAKIDWLDEKTDGTVEALATRKSDSKTLAI